MDNIQFRKQTELKILAQLKQGGINRTLIGSAHLEIAIVKSLNIEFDIDLK